MRPSIMTAHQFRRLKVPTLQCLSCGETIFLDDTTYVDYQGPVVCYACKASQDVLIEKKRLVKANKIADIYAPIRDILNYEVPPDLVLDLAEAASDFGGNGFKSSVVMCRRCLQGALLEQKVKDASLEDMIEAAKGTVLQERLYLNAKSIQFFGNSGAHPLDPALRRVEQIDAYIVLQLTKAILQSIYPKRADTPPELQSGTG